MTAESPAELAARALTLIDGDAQATVTRERSLHARFARSASTQATSVTDTSVELLSVRDGFVGAATTNDLSDDGLRDASARAVEAARAACESHPGSSGPYPGLPEPQTPRAHEGFDLRTARLTPSSAGDALTTIFGLAAEHGLEAFGIWTAGEVRTAIASTAGVEVSDAVTDAYLKVIVRDADGRTGHAAAAGTTLDAVDAAAVTREAIRKLPRGAPADVAPGELPVVLGPEALAEILDFLGLLAFNGATWAEGRSAVSDRLGTRVAAAAINLSDSPRFRGTLPRAFDAEGVPKAPVPLIQDGVAHRVVHDTRSAAKAGGGARSTGHATEPGGSPSGPVPTNLVLVGGGAADEDELAAPIERGLYVNRLWYVNPVHERETLLTGVTRDGTFLIEDGRITRPARDVRFTDTALGLLDRVQALTARPVLVGRSDFYGRRFATGVVCPAVRCASLRISGGA